MRKLAHLMPATKSFKEVQTTKYLAHVLLGDCGVVVHSCVTGRPYQRGSFCGPGSEHVGSEDQNDTAEIQVQDQTRHVGHAPSRCRSY